jgi:hypothetical protein
MANQLPILVETGGKKTEGFCTPKTDTQPQTMTVPPKRVLPIVFFPGIMGSNLRLKQPRQWTLKKPNNIAWNPDRKGEAIELLDVTPADRQLLLDPDATEVDSYDDGFGPTGTAAERIAARHNVGSLGVDLDYKNGSPLLVDDPQTMKNRKTKAQKSRERGWGEVLFSSYKEILARCENHLNNPDPNGYWKRIINQSPEKWQASRNPPLRPLCESELLDAYADTWFPVHAMGYNWLQSNVESARILGGRIKRLIDDYRKKGFICEKVIVVTHSMGGLVGRALIHPKMGGRGDLVLGIVHGVMPAMGAPAAYRRMRCGFEEGALGLAIPPKVLGNYGPEVTAVLANSEGGLQLLPNKKYGNNWLVIRQGRNVISSLPSAGDPYSEIYKLRGTWFGLIREDWINPAKRPGASVTRTFSYIDKAMQFHDALENTFHENTYAHYGADESRASWERIVWNIGPGDLVRGWEKLRIVFDDFQGSLRLQMPPASRTEHVQVTLGDNEGAGDQTVPLRSADWQLASGKLRGVFRQSGYEHQKSYQSEDSLNSTLYSLIKIIQCMKWSSN